MVVSNGIDVIEVSRIAKSVKNPKFLQKYFSEKERQYFSSRKNTAVVIAGTFAAKEAFSKAVGRGVRGFLLCEVSVLRDDFGKPFIELTGSAQKLFGQYRFCVSISHSKAYAVANVIAVSGCISE